MTRQYLVAFNGSTREGFEATTVASQLAKAMSKPDSYGDRLLNGTPTVLKRTTDLEAANDAVMRLEAIGANTTIIEVPTQVPVEVSENNKSDKVNGELITDSPTQALSVTPDPQTSTEPVAAQRISFLADADNASTAERSWRQRVQYRFDTFMARGISSSFKALLFVFVAIFLLVAGVRGLLYWANPELTQQYESLDVLGNIYITFLQLTDPGNMAQDILSSAWYKFFAIAAGLFGIIMLSGLVAVITTGLDQKLTDLRRGRSKVIEEDHTLIIGWDEQRILEIIRELVLANESEKDACVVILADQDKQQMDEVLRLRLADTLTTRIVTRTGRGTILSMLDMVSVESAKSVIVLAGCTDTDSESLKIASDAQVIQTVLAVSTKSVEKPDYAIVAEIYNDTYRSILDSTFPDFVVTMDTGNILARLLVQTSRSVGLSVVYGEILSFDGCEMYFYQDDWKDSRFSDLAYHFPDGVPIGVRHADESLSINPASDYVMLPDDEILIVADDDSTIEYKAQPVALPTSYAASGAIIEQQIERELLIGWNQKSETIIREFSDYVKDGSEIDIIVDNPTEKERAEIARINESIDNITVTLITINPLNRTELISITPTRYNNIIILAGVRDDKDSQQVDSENIVILLLLRSIFSELPNGCDTKLITEVLESQNQALISKAGVKDMIISNQLISMITAQTSESPGMNAVYNDLFQENGSEIYLKPVHLYFDQVPAELKFADLISAAAQRGEVCFGIKTAADEDDQSKNYGVELIPAKDCTFNLSANDCLVVVAENEL